MLTARGITVDFDGHLAVDRVDVSVADGETLALVGRSGSGKTTLLRAIAGLIPGSAGMIEVDGVDLTDTAPHLRGIGLVFQDFALFPHLDVAANVAYGLHGVADSAERVAAALRRVDLEGLEQRSIDQLSGGQAQRVALARTLVTRPRILLLDEPMGSLDRAYRRQVAEELGRLLRDTAIPTVLVTHDVEEAFALGDRVMVLEDGQVATVGTPDEVWTDPGTPDAARILGHTAVFEAVVESGTARVDRVSIPLALGTADGLATILIRNARTVDVGGVPLRVEYSRFSGPAWVTGLRIGSAILETPTPQCCPIGSHLSVAIDPDDVIVF